MFQSLLTRWRQSLVIAATALLLPAVPVSALTFLTPWKVVQRERSDGAPAATFIADFAGPGTLLVDMGRTTSESATSRVRATRRFSIGPGDERISISQAFQTLLSDASLKVKIKIRPHGFSIPESSFAARGRRERVFQEDRTTEGTLSPGEYRLRISIIYENEEGVWDNTAPPPGSPHTFAIRSL